MSTSTYYTANKSQPFTFCLTIWSHCDPFRKKSRLEPAVCQWLRTDSLLPPVRAVVAQSTPQFINMTKHWGGQSLLAPPAITYLPSRSFRAHYDHHLDFAADARASNAYPTCPPSSIARNTPAPRWNSKPSPWPAQDPSRLERPTAVPVACGTAPMDSAMPQDRSRQPSPFYPAPPRSQDPPVKQHRSDPPDTWDQEGNAKGGRKKNYQRYPKPPYSYLAMIAMVIQNSPEKKLTLSQILKEISTLFPFFKGNYKGWRDSVRHNLSSYDCFVKVLKDPGKPQGKGNFWVVELSRVPLELLKRQNTAVSRQDETIFAQDLAPYILHGHTHKPEAPESPPAPPPCTRGDPPPAGELYRPKLDSSFAIDSLLHSLRPSSTAGEGERSRDLWGSHHIPIHGLHPRPPRTRATPTPHAAPRLAQPAPRPRAQGEAGSDGYEDCRPPPHKASRRNAPPPWELPTSYAKYAPPNVVAPPSMRFNGGPFLPLGGLPFYSYRGPPNATSGHFMSHTYWPLLPNGRVPLQAPPILMDLDSLLQSVPPNKSVFDVLGPPSQSSHPPTGQYALQSTNPLSRYPQY
ncbi:hypothetical protein AAFF_G00160030 [Aldrovandia affinis]|uniref:Fork-head domain-containing protein n=1 Tax=Aldrovandia affinis TaxID=143900 RepID=A0AAD7W7K9_9TELE|nr:hypothetical protein AAFF_G00160030 [Aldrovandia affinis]